ncbi:MAG: hypothetical protein ACI87E_000603 [Mariniblastus sp.]|jgi:hypothetical protein
MNIIERITGLKISTRNPTRERGIVFVGSVPRLRVLKLQCFSPEGDTGDAGAVRHRITKVNAREARRAAQIVTARNCVALWAGSSENVRIPVPYDTGSPCSALRAKEKVLLQNSRVELRSRIASKKIGAAQ